MSIQTTSLETSRLLKENWFRQDNISKYHVHRIDSRGREEWSIEDLYTFPRDKVKKFIAAPTTDELLSDITAEGMLAYYTRLIPDGESIGDLILFTKDLLDLCRDPNKLAEVWLWLKKEGLL